MFQAGGRLRMAVIASTFFVATAATTAPAPFSSAPASVESFDAGTLHVEKFGSGAETIILIPGLACGSWVWYDTIAKFSHSYTVYAITLPGFDGRAAANEKSLFMAFARDFWAMLAKNKIDKPAVIGHSLGGTLAIALGEDHPELLSGIIAADGLPVFPAVASATPQQRETAANQMADAFAQQSKVDAFATQRNYMSTTGTNKPELVEPAARLEARSDPKAVAAWTREDLLADLRPNLGKITVPFLELMPYETPDTNQLPSYSQEQTLAFYKSLIAGAPKATVEAIAPSRHFVMLDQPEAFYKVVAEFLKSIKQ